MTIEEIYKWAVKHDCENHTLSIYCNQTNYDYCEENFEITEDVMKIYTPAPADTDNYNRENFVEVQI